MTGNVAPDIVKPVPLSVAEFTVTGAVPTEASVTGCVDDRAYGHIAKSHTSRADRQSLILRHSAEQAASD